MNLSTLLITGFATMAVALPFQPFKLPLVGPGVEAPEVPTITAVDGE